MTGEGVVSEKDCVAAQYLNMRPRGVLAVIGTLICLLAVVLMLISVSWPLVGVMAFLVAWYFVYVPWASKRNYRQYKAMARAYTVELTDEGYRTFGEHGEGTIPWSDIASVRHNKNLLLIYPTSNLFYIVPHHFFESREAFAAFIADVERRVEQA